MPYTSRPITPAPDTITDQYGNTFPVYRNAYDYWYRQRKASEAKDWRWLWDYLKKYPEKRTPETIPPFQDSTVQKPKLPKPAIPQPQTKVASLVKLAAAMQKTAVLSWNPLDWAKSEDEYRWEQYEKERMAALQQFENNMNALDPGRAQRMEAMRQQDTQLANMINQRITDRTMAAGERQALAANNQLPGELPVIASGFKQNGQYYYRLEDGRVLPAQQVQAMYGFRTQQTPSTAVASNPVPQRPAQAVPPPSAAQPPAQRQQPRSKGVIRNADGSVWQAPQSTAPRGGGSITINGRTTTMGPQPRQPQQTPPPSAGTQRRQGYKTPDGQWHDITPGVSGGPVTAAEMGRVTLRQPQAKLPQTHFKMQPGAKGVTRSMYKQTV